MEDSDALLYHLPCEHLPQCQTSSLGHDSWHKLREPGKLRELRELTENFVPRLRRDVHRASCFFHGCGRFSKQSLYIYTKPEPSLIVFFS